LTVRILKLTIVVCLLLAVSFQAHAQPDGNMTDTSYDPVFNEVIDADDREEAAESTGLSYRDGDLHVVVELNANKEVPSGYDVEVVQETVVDNRTSVEAWVPVDDVRELASEEEVERVRQPVGAVPAQDNSGSDRETENDTEGNETTQEEGRNEEKNDDDDEPMPGFTYIAAFVALLLVASGLRRL
jgi:ABC-type Na+ efflux pump permease subunit